MHLIIPVLALLFIWLGLKAFTQATGDAFDQFQLLLREEVDNAVHDLTLPTDDVSWSLLDTFQPVEVAGKATNAAGLSNSGQGVFEASWRVLVQRGGAVKPSTMAGGATALYGPGNRQMMGQTATATYLDPASTPGRSYFDIKMLLKRAVGQLTINRTQIFADLATKPIAQVASETTEDAVYQVRNMWESMFWHQGSGVIALADGEQTVTEDDPVYVDIKEGTAFRFVVGQRYVAYTMTGTEPTTAIDGDGSATTADGAAAQTGVFRCVAIDIDTGQPAFQSEPDEGDVVLSDGCGILLFGAWTGTASLAMNSIETLLCSSGDYPGTGYDVTTYRELKSFVSGDVDTLVEPEIEVLIGIIDKMAQAGQPVPPMVVAEASVWSRMALLEKQAYGMVSIPQGGQFQAAPGVAGPQLSHQSFNFQRVNSAKCRPGAWHGFNPASFKRFMPLSNTIRWLMTQGGVSNQSGIFRLITSSGIATELSAADFDFFAELGQDNPRSAFRRVGLYSQNTAS